MAYSYTKERNFSIYKDKCGICLLLYRATAMCMYVCVSSVVLLVILSKLGFSVFPKA